MVLVAALLLAVATVPLAGGRLSRLASLDLRRSGLVVSAFALQVLAVSVFPGLPAWAVRSLHVASYVALGVFLVVNRRVPGLWLVAVGAGANALAIIANGGVMPASAAALRAADRLPAPGRFANSVPVDDARLAFLGDVFALPRWMPLHNVFSVGDVLIAFGAALVVHRACGSRLGRGRPLGRRGIGRPADSHGQA